MADNYIFNPYTSDDQTADQQTQTADSSAPKKDSGKSKTSSTHTSADDTSQHTDTSQPEADQPADNQPAKRPLALADRMAIEADKSIAQVSERIAQVSETIAQTGEKVVQAAQSIAVVASALSVVNDVMALNDKLAMPLNKAMASLMGMASLPVAAHFSPVLGVDVHFVKIPPSPVVPMPHPYVGMVFDPRDFIAAAMLSVATQFVPPATDEDGNGAAANMVFSGLTMAMSMTGATVLVNGVPRAVSGVKTKNTHFPLGAGFSLPMPQKSKGHVQFGSLTVGADGDPLTGMMHLNNDCWDVGMPALPRGKRSNSEPTFYLPTGSILPIPMGKPVLVNPTPIPINPQALLFKFAGGAFSKLKRWTKGSKKMKALANKVHGKAAKLMDKLHIPHKLRDAVHKSICTALGHPVDVASGRLFTDNEDFSLAGPIPLVWERTWYSDSDYQGPLGHGWHHSYDMALSIDEITLMAAIRLDDGRGVSFVLPQVEQPSFDRKEKLTLHRHSDSFYYLTDQAGIHYCFSKELYQDEHKLVSITNAYGFENEDGHRIGFEYNTQGHLIRITDSANRVLTVRNDELGRIVSISAPHPEQYPGQQGQTFQIARYCYNTEGDLGRWYNALDHSMEYVYQNHLLLEEVWRNGLHFYFRYDGDRTGARCIRTWGENNLLHYQLQYEQGVTHATNSLGHLTSYYHHAGLVYKKVNAEGAEWQTHYNEHTELVEEIDPLGNSTAYMYDEQGNLTTVIYPDNGVIQMSYHPNGKPSSATDQIGGKWQWAYDGMSNLIRKTDPTGATIAYQYRKGLLHSVTGANGQATTLQYDFDYNLIGIDYAEQLRETFRYDKLGRCTTTTDVRGNNTHRQYDLLGRVTQVSEWDSAAAEGNTSHLTYDALDNVIGYRDRNREVKMSYKGLWKMSSRTQSGSTLKFTYDTEGQLRTVINEKGEQYQFDLDSEGEIIKETGFDGLTRSYQRNRAGWVERLLRPNGKTTAYGYDSNGRVVEVNYSDGQSEQYAYDRAGNLVKATNAQAEVILERDILGRVIKESSNGHWIESRFDALGNRTHIGSSLGADISHEFDVWGNTIGRQSKGWQSQIKRDKFGLEEQILLPGGISSHWKRDQRGRISAHWVNKANNQPPAPLRNHQYLPDLLRSVKYEWDIEDRLKTLTDPLGGMMQFEHDSFGNLTKTTFGDGKAQLRNPDPVGNLFETKDRTDRKYDKGGKLLESKGATYKYDKEGNLIEKKEKNGKVWLYEWNAAGMLVKVTRPDKDQITFGYDALGRRIWKRFYNTITRWIWDGDKPLHEWKEHALTGDILSDTTVGTDGIITWLFDEDSFAPVAKLKGEKKYSILTDHLGTPIQMYQEDGTRFWQGELDSYGRMRMEKGEAGSCPFRYQGQYEDKETGLYYNRFRYYSPEEGIYISQDPTGLLGGYKIYGYVKDTNTLIDSTGLAAYDPNWKSTQTGDTSKNSAILRKNLGITTNSNTDAHHIVHSTHRRGQKARDILDKYQIDINDEANGVGLVGGKGAAKNVLPRHHRGGGLHSHEGVDAVVDRIEKAQDGITDWAKGRETVLSELQLIRTEIVNGSFP